MWPSKGHFPTLVCMLRQPVCDGGGSSICRGMADPIPMTVRVGESVEWDNLCRVFDLHPMVTGVDEVS